MMPIPMTQSRCKACAQPPQLHREGHQLGHRINIGLAKKGDKLDKPVVFRGGAEKDGYIVAVRPA